MANSFGANAPFWYVYFKERIISMGTEYGDPERSKDPKTSMFTYFKHKTNSYIIIQLILFNKFPTGLVSCMIPGQFLILRVTK